ncbi:MAG: phytoene/squalene synthase family protein [Verrucomicrobia bacterium]|nr:phytoene/squalene synthase family protein [Verrucomicrobiota bacterium]
MQHGLNQLLKAVSRSFYLTIRLLPATLRAPVGLAYLLARTSDTVADSAGAPTEVRLALLRQMKQALCGGGPLPDLAPLARFVSDPAERRLLEQTGTLWAWLGTMSPEDRGEIAWVFVEILRGQKLDLSRFGCGEGVRALATAEELEDYTYSVAGCVGEFWTRMCNHHLRQYAPGISGEELSRLGASFGKGLQLVNILRDASADLANGRWYLPADELGCDPEALRGAPELARSVCDQWMARAGAHLEDGLRYIHAVRPWRLRLACFLPWALGVRTLALLQRNRPLETARRVKVPRKELRRLLVLGALGACSAFALRQVAAHIRRHD